MYRLINPIRHYDWGSTTLLQDFCGLEQDGRPAAEMWMGAHPDDPSTVVEDGAEVALDALIAADPEHALGRRVIARFGPRLPFLAKFLAAGSPLSLQVHPSLAQARHGFDDEDARGVAMDDPARRYRDRAHKPELLYALTHFDLMARLREPSVSAGLLAELDVPALDPFVSLLREPTGEPHRKVFTSLLSDRGAPPGWIPQVVAAAGRLAPGRPEFAAILELDRRFPGDTGLLAPLLLNYEQLAPGDTVFTPDGALHAYVRGLGIEVMASSDNVLRAGLTSKPVDVAEVLRIADFSAEPEGRLVAQDLDFHAPVADFALAILRAAPGSPVAGPADGPRIAMGIEGITILTSSSGRLALERGQSAFLLDADGPFGVEGTGRIAVAHV